MITYPNYDRSILSIASSVLNHFGVKDCQHKTLPEFDKLLEKDYKNIIVMLFDGLGVSAINEHLNENDFLRKHFVCPISSVYPSTTVAATTAIESGYSPAETAWLGWDLYFDEIGENVAVFRNALQKNGEPAADYNVGWTHIPYKRIFERIEEINGKGSAIYVSPFSKHHIKSVPHICRTVKSLSRRRKKKYIYTYWHQPDTEMHYYGVKSEQAHEQILLINSEVEKLCKRLKNSLVIITADHGLCDGVNEYLEDYPELSAMLKRPPSIEPRALSFFVKDGMKDDFRNEFNKLFGDDFKLLTKEDVLAKNLLGFGKPHPKTYDFVGDFLAVATGEKSLFIEREERPFIGVHAGLTEEEMTVPFIAIETKKGRKMNKTNQELYYERTPVLETERLILRPLTPDDAETAFLWHSDPRVNKFMSYPLYTDISQTMYWISKVIPVEEDFHWGIVLKEGNILIGSISIGPAGNDDGAWGFGYNIRYEYWNRGYTTEATKRIIEFSREVHGVKDFTASHAVDNPASGRVMEKCGLKFESYGEHSKSDGSVTYEVKNYRMHMD